MGSFGTGSLEFIKALREKLQNLGLGEPTIHVRKPDKVKSKNPHYYLRVGGEQAAKFCEFLYDNVSPDLVLLRKALVYEKWRGRLSKSLFSDLPAKKPSRLRRQRCVHIMGGELCTQPALPGEVYCRLHHPSSPPWWR